MLEPSKAGSIRISVRPLLYRPGERRTIVRTLDAETTAQYGLSCAVQPVLDGVLENQAGVLFFRYTVSCVLLAECDRCLTPVRLTMHESFEHVVVTQVESEQNDSEYLLAPDAMLDVADVVMTDLRLSLPSKTLCKPDCLGICPCCGQSRNDGACTCASDDVTQVFRQP